MCAFRFNVYVFMPPFVFIYNMVNCEINPPYAKSRSGNRYGRTKAMVPQKNRPFTVVVALAPGPPIPCVLFLKIWHPSYYFVFNGGRNQVFQNSVHHKNKVLSFSLNEDSDDDVENMPDIIGEDDYIDLSGSNNGIDEFEGFQEELEPPHRNFSTTEQPVKFKVKMKVTIIRKQLAKVLQMDLK